MFLSNRFSIFLTILVIVLSMFAFSKKTIEKAPILPRLYLYVVNIFVFYIAFNVQKHIIDRTVSASVAAFKTIEDFFILSFIGIIVFSILLMIDKFYKEIEETKELSHIVYSTIFACVFGMLTPGTYYVILSVIVIDLILLFTKNVEIRYVAILGAWFFVIFLNDKIIKYEKEQAVIAEQQDPKVIMTEKAKNKIKEAPKVGKYTFELTNEAESTKKSFSFNIKNDEITLENFNVVFEKNHPTVYFNKRDLMQGNLFNDYINQNNEELIKTLDYIFKTTISEEIRADLLPLVNEKIFEYNEKINKEIEIKSPIYRENTLIIPINYSHSLSLKPQEKESFLKELSIEKQKEIIERINKLNSKTLKKFKKKNISIGFFNPKFLSEKREDEIVRLKNYEEIKGYEYISYYSATLEDGKITINE
jgi:membrane protein